MGLNLSPNPRYKHSMRQAATPSIYGLFDASGALRYIGKANDPKARLRGHMREATNGRRRTPLYDWLRKHGLPAMQILEADCADWQASEKRLIAEARTRGDKLLNLADGGNEPFCSIAVRSANGRNLVERLRADKNLHALWFAKRTLGWALRRGQLLNCTREKMRLLAVKLPSMFGEWANIPDVVETA